MFKIGITLDEVKESLKIDYDDEDVFLTLCLDAATAHLESAIDDYDTKITDEKFAKKAKMVIIITIQDMFDNRNYISGVYSDKVKYIIQSLMAQMRWS